MTIKEIEKVKKNMGEINFYQYFFFDGDYDFMIEHIENFKESEKIIRLIFELVKDNKDYEVELFESSLSFENKKTKNNYKISIEF